MLEPGAGLARSALPPGSYHCRVIRLGAGPGHSAFTAYPSYFCHVGVEGPLLSFTKQTGSERPGGYIWNDSDERLVFLGAMARGNEDVPPPYGDGEARDMAGIVERIGPFRYRIVFPWPTSGATLDVIELVPSLAGRELGAKPIVRTACLFALVITAFARAVGVEQGRHQSGRADADRSAGDDVPRSP